MITVKTGARIILAKIVTVKMKEKGNAKEKAQAKVGTMKDQTDQPFSNL